MNYSDEFGPQPQENAGLFAALEEELGRSWLAKEWQTVSPVFMRLLIQSGEPFPDLPLRNDREATPFDLGNIGEMTSISVEDLSSQDLQQSKPDKVQILDRAVARAVQERYLRLGKEKEFDWSAEEIFTEAVITGEFIRPEALRRLIQIYTEITEEIPENAADRLEEVFSILPKNGVITEVEQVEGDPLVIDCGIDDDLAKLEKGGIPYSKEEERRIEDATWRAKRQVIELLEKSGIRLYDTTHELVINELTDLRSVLNIEALAQPPCDPLLELRSMLRDEAEELVNKEGLWLSPTWNTLLDNLFITEPEGNDRGFIAGQLPGHGRRE